MPMFRRSLNKLLLTPLALTASSIYTAAEPQCANPANTVKELPPQNATTIARHFWESGRDRYKGHLKTLHIFFKNGDYAVLQHQYCTMYNFEAVYFRNGQEDDLDAAGIVGILTDLYERYAAKKATFKRPLADIISASLKERGFSDDKDIRVGLPENDADYPNKRVQYSIHYSSLQRNTSVYSSVSTFYLGIGGMH